jgi:protein-disulfide isomerase
MRIKVLSILLCFGLTQFSYAQTINDAKGEREGELSVLRREVSALQDEQKDILSRLDELKQLLETNDHKPSSMPSSKPKAPSTLDIHGEIFRGSSNARVAIIEYADFECPYCREYERTVFPQLLIDYIRNGKVKYVYRDLTLPMHPFAIPAARAARCAGEQGKFWEMHDSIFAKQGSPSAPAFVERAKALGLDGGKFAECFSSDRYTEDISKSVSYAQTLGIEGTPTFFIGTVDGDIVRIAKAIQGGPPFEVFKTNLDALLEPKSQAVVATH